MKIRIEALSAAQKKEKPEPTKLGFGRYFTDHMLVTDWRAECGWHEARIVPYGPFLLEPAAAVFHYAQEVFEGLKAFRLKNGKIGLFRPDMHLTRLNRSAARVALPQVDADLFFEGLTELLRIDRDWIPSAEDTALYIRPALIATEAALGVKPARECRFFIILSPSGAYAGKSGRVLVEEKLVRAATGGTGEAKTGGNYAASLLAAKKASEGGFDQVLWLDGIEHRYIEEAGAMNIFFVTDKGMVTPKLSGTFLAGITRDSLLQLASTLGIAIEERRVTIDEVMVGIKSGYIREIFATGTAAVIWPITQLGHGGETLTVGDGMAGPRTQLLRETLTGIQFGRLPDPFGWMQEI
jgi:branched-chain amino acid aminotransferase